MILQAHALEVLHGHARRETGWLLLLFGQWVTERGQPAVLPPVGEKIAAEVVAGSGNVAGVRARLGRRIRCMVI
jgi:hypothetical protein